MTARDDELVDAYLAALLRGDKRAAASAIDQALQAGWSIPRLYIDVLLLAQVRLGELWQAGDVNVADEHLGSHITLEQMDRLRGKSQPVARLPYRAVVAAVEGNEHMIGARAVADFLDMDGWNVDFLGANAPAKDLAELAARRRANLVALSVSRPQQLTAAALTIAKLKAQDAPPAVIVGGAGLANGGAKADDIGADGTAEDALGAVRLARRLLGLAEWEALLGQYLKELGRRVQRLRKQLGLSQAQLAERATLDRAYLSSVEHGKQNLSISAILKLATAFEIPLETLLTGQGLSGVSGDNGGARR